LIEWKPSPPNVVISNRWMNTNYQAFVRLNQLQIEKLAIALMLDQRKEVRLQANSAIIEREENTTI